MPLMHSENKADTRQCIIEYTKIDKQMESEGVDNNMQMNIKFAQDHDVIVQTFGRYPARNKALDRESTEDEMEYLKTAETYGQ